MTVVLIWIKKFTKHFTFVYCPSSSSKKRPIFYLLQFGISIIVREYIWDYSLLNDKEVMKTKDADWRKAIHITMECMFPRSKRNYPVYGCSRIFSYINTSLLFKAVFINQTYPYHLQRIPYIHAKSLFRSLCYLTANMDANKNYLSLNGVHITHWAKKQTILFIT